MSVVRSLQSSRLWLARWQLRWLLLLGILAFPLLYDSEADIDSAANAAAFAALALGLNIVVGFAGLLDLGYAAFFAIGAYAYGILSSFQIEPAWSSFWEPFATLGLVARLPGDLVHFTVSFWIMLPISALLAAFFGFLFGAPTLRLRGDYLAIVTLGFGEIVPIVVRNSPSLTNGAAGLNGIAAPSLFGESFGLSVVPYYYVAVSLVVFLAFVSARLRNSRIGRAWMAVREDELAAGAMGVDPARTKLLAFSIGAAFAGMTGTFYVAKLQTATPEMFGFPVSVMILVMVVLGGVGSVPGVVLGAVILVLLQSWWLQDLTEWLHVLGREVSSPWLQSVDLARATELIFGLILIVMMLYRREGLIPATRSGQPELEFQEQRTEGRRSRVDPVLTGTFGLAEKSRDAALKVSEIEVRFGGLIALQSVSLSVPVAGVVSIIGPNGSGKSTLFNVITGLTKPASGSIRFEGQEIVGLRPHRVLAAGLARTFQEVRLFPNLSVMDNVLVGLHARLRTGVLGAVLQLASTRTEERAAREWAIEVLGLFGNRLLSRLNDPVRGLSYANRRRVEIARALASRPRILLLDEPTAGMNPVETRELAEQLAGLHALGLTLLVIEHKLDVVARLSETVVVLENGKLIAQGTPSEVRRNEEVLRAYLGRTATMRPLTDVF